MQGVQDRQQNPRRQPCPEAQLKLRQLKLQFLSPFMAGPLEALTGSRKPVPLDNSSSIKLRSQRALGVRMNERQTTPSISPPLPEPKDKLIGA